MAYDGAVSAIKHGAVFATVGIVLTNLIITILLPFIAYTILKTASVAAKKTIFTTMSICKNTTTTLVNLQIKTCKTTVKLVSNLTKTSLEMTQLLMKQMMKTMRRLAGFGRQYCSLCLTTVLKFKDLTISFVKRGLTIITTSVKITVSTVKKMAEMVLIILTEAPQQLYALMKVIFAKVFPGMVKIMIYFPQEYFKFMNNFLPSYINLVTRMCKTAIELDMAATSLVVTFQLIAMGIRFMGRFFSIGKQFIGDFVSGINGILDVIPAFGEILDSDTIASIPDKLISFIIYDLKFKTGLNELFDASTTSLPEIEAKKAEIADLATILSNNQTRQEALIKQVAISPDPEKSLEISQLEIIINGLEGELATLQGQLDLLEFNRVYTFDELYLRFFFWVISLLHVYTAPPPVLELIKIYTNFIFYKQLTPEVFVDLSFSDSWGYSDLLDVEISVSASFTINPITLGLFFPDVPTAINSFTDWLNGRLSSEDAYEIVDGKKKSKLRAISRNPAAFVKFTIKILIAWLQYAVDAIGFNLEDLVSISFGFSTSFDFLGVEIDIDVPSDNEILENFIGTVDGASWVLGRAISFMTENYGSLLAYFLAQILTYVSEVIFAGLDAVYPSDNFDWL